MVIHGEGSRGGTVATLGTSHTITCFTPDPLFRALYSHLIKEAKYVEFYEQIEQRQLAVVSHATQPDHAMRWCGEADTQHIRSTCESIAI